MGRVPEQVSFRLTTNVIDGFGVVGVEGVFRKSAECVLSVLKQNKQTLLQSLRSFIFDPLLMEGQNSGSQGAAKRNMMKQLNDVIYRLDGHVPSMQFDHENPKKYPSIDIGKNAPLSIKGCVEKLITINSNKHL